MIFWISEPFCGFIRTTDSGKYCFLLGRELCFQLLVAQPTSVSKSVFYTDQHKRIALRVENVKMFIVHEEWKVIFIVDVIVV